MRTHNTNPHGKETDDVRIIREKEGKPSEGGIMSLEAVRRLAWTAIILFIAALLFATNHGPMLAWLAANHAPLLAGIIQSPLWAVAFLLVILMLLCVTGIMDDDGTPFAIGMHALGIMLCFGYWAGGSVFASHQPDDVAIYGLAGGFILACLFAWIMDRRRKAGRETFPRLRDQIAGFAVDHIASDEYRESHTSEEKN